MKFFKFCFVHAINSFIVRCFRKTVCQEMRGSPVWNHFQKVRKCVCDGRSDDTPIVYVVKKIFCIPATSVPSEQIFSKAGLLISKQRNGLKPSNVDMLIFFNKNV
jgi:hypothetical protein